MWLQNYEWHLDYIRLAKDSSFSFEKSKFPLDKNKICMIDLDEIIEKNNVDIIEQFLPSIVQYNIDTNEHMGILDQNFLKLFRMSQLAVEYLLFCKKYLDHNVILLKEEIKDIKMENKELRVFNDELKQHTDTLLGKLKMKGEMNAIFKCNKCSKAFSTEAYLSAHIDRRHTNISGENLGLDIEMEIKEIKEKLNNTEKLIKKEELSPKLEDTLNKNYNKVSELLLKFDSLRSQVENDFKMLHTQKDFEEKYLKIFQSALENVKIQINKELGIQSSPYKFLEKRNSITQTDSDEINTFEKHVQVDDISAQQIEPPKQQFEELKLQKLEDQMKNACESISITMGSSLRNIEVQMQALWDKLQGLESKTTIFSKNPDVNENVKTSACISSEPKPKVRKRYKSKLENVSKTSDPSLMNEEKELEVDVLTRPMSDTRYDTLDDVKEEIPFGNSKIISVVGLKSSVPLKSKLKNDDLDRIDVLDEVEPSKTITVVKSINSLYETEEVESDESTQLSSVVISETKASNKESLKEFPIEDHILHKEKSGSTLGKRSISSLRRASLSTEVVEKLKKEMEKILSDRLTILGVSNDWKGIPQQSYMRVMDILNHQANLIQKSIPDYTNIRKEILNNVKQELQRKGLNKTDIRKSKKNIRGISSMKTLKDKNSSLRMRKQNSTPEVEIRNRKMYESETSSSEEDKNKCLRKSVSTIVHKTPNYSAVIAELKQCQKPEDEKKVLCSHDNNLEKMDLQMKSVLKNFPTAGPVPKKRVLFDLKRHESNIQKPVARDVSGGSTTSVASSMLDLSDSSQKTEEKEKIDTQLDIQDFSDSDFSIVDKQN